MPCVCSVKENCCHPDLSASSASACSAAIPNYIKKILIYGDMKLISEIQFEWCRCAGANHFMHIHSIGSQISGMRICMHRISDNLPINRTCNVTGNSVPIRQKE